MLVRAQSMMHTNAHPWVICCCMGFNCWWLYMHVQAFKLSTVRHQELLRQAQLEQVRADRETVRRA